MHVRAFNTLVSTLPPQTKLKAMPVKPLTFTGNAGGIQQPPVSYPSLALMLLALLFGGVLGAAGANYQNSRSQAGQNTVELQQPVTDRLGEFEYRAHQNPVPWGGLVSEQAKVDPSVYMSDEAMVVGPAKVEGRSFLYGDVFVHSSAENPVHIQGSVLDNRKADKQLVVTDGASIENSHLNGAMAISGAKITGSKLVSLDSEVQLRLGSDVVIQNGQLIQGTITATGGPGSESTASYDLQPISEIPDWIIP